MQQHAVAIFNNQGIRFGRREGKKNRQEHKESKNAEKP
jgi:hypothetical protein